MKWNKINTHIKTKKGPQSPNGWQQLLSLYFDTKRSNPPQFSLCFFPYFLSSTPSMNSGYSKIQQICFISI